MPADSKSKTAKPNSQTAKSKSPKTGMLAAKELRRSAGVTLAAANKIPTGKEQLQKAAGHQLAAANAMLRKPKHS